MALFNNYMQCNVYGKMDGKPWQNTFCFAVDSRVPLYPEGSIAYDLPAIKDTWDAIWNDNGLVWGLQRRYAALLPNAFGYSVDGFKIIARSGTMLAPVQYEGGIPMVGQGSMSAADVDTNYTAMYAYAPAENYGQVGAKMWVPYPDENGKVGNQWSSAVVEAMSDTATGILWGINNPDINFTARINGDSESGLPYVKVVVQRIKTVVAPPSPPYKGVYKYDFPYLGTIAAFNVADYEIDLTVTTNRSRKL